MCPTKMAPFRPLLVPQSFSVKAVGWCDSVWSSADFELLRGSATFGLPAENAQETRRTAGPEKGPPLGIAALGCDPIAVKQAHPTPPASRRIMQFGGSRSRLAAMQRGAAHACASSAARDRICFAMRNATSLYSCCASSRADGSEPSACIMSASGRSAYQFS
eukprot:SAG31_NODE_10849_length_1090_cov_3.407669_2_plen_162_part_00